MTPEELLRAPEAAFDREIGLRCSFYEFVKMAWPHILPYEFKDGWHIRLICDVLERCYRGELRKIVINIPPGCMKSLLVGVFWPVWCWVRDPSLGFLATSFDVTLTRRDSARSLQLIQGEWFRARWGDVVWVEDGAGAGEHHNARGGVRFATSIGSKAMGRHPDVRIIDDPIKPQEISPATLADAENYWNTTLRTRQRDPKSVRTVLIMQRLAVHDLAGVFRKEGDWHFVVLPMRYEPGPEAYASDPRRGKGELLWPERFGEPEVQELERMPPRDRAAQLQQRPVPEGGAIIKEEWIQWYDPKHPPPFSMTLQSWDLSFKGVATSDFVAGQLWGTSGPNYYLVDAILERLDFVGSVKAILAMCTAHPGSSVLIEDKANGPAVMSALEGKVSGVVAVEPQGGKAARLNAVSPLFEARNVYLPRGNPIAEALALSLQSFPFAPHDDDVDACTQALNYMHANVLDYAGMMRGLTGGAF